MPTDQELVRLVIDGERAAADEFVVRFSRYVYSILHRNLGVDPDTADDLFQAVFVHLFEDDCRRMRLWRGEGDFAVYLGPIVRNLALGHLRGRQAREDPDGLDFDSLVGSEPTPEEEAAILEHYELLQAAVRQLRPRDRELYRLRYEEQRSYRDIAETLGMTVNHVGVALLRLEVRLERGISPETGVKVRSDGPRASTD